MGGTQKAGAQFPALFKAVVTNTGEPRTSYGGAGGSEVQGCPWLHSEFEARDGDGVGVEISSLNRECRAFSSCHKYP